MSERKAYPSDLTDAEWAQIEPLVPGPLPGGRPAKYERRELIHAILYVLRSGCAWRLMPHDLPPKERAYAYFERWSEDGTWEKIEAALRGKVCRAAGKKPAPTAAILDSQAVKTSDAGGPRGFDVAKPPIGRKRHLLVDTLGLIWLVHVTAASVQGPRRRAAPVRPSLPAWAGTGAPDLGGQRLQGAKALGRVGRAPAAPGRAPGGGRTRRGRQRLCRTQTPLGGRADLRLAQQVPSPEQRL